MNEKEQFRTVAGMAVLTILCVVCLGVLIVMRDVTEANSAGLNNIIEFLKQAASGLIGALTAMIKLGMTATATGTNVKISTEPPPDAPK